jgi:putative ABC transport system ATP-binding protein
MIGVSKHFDAPGASEPVVALEDVTLEVSPGEAVAIMGGSGSGKSSLLNLLGAMDTPTAGAVVVDGQDLSRLDLGERARHRRRIGMVFQQFHLLSGLGALENVVAPLVPYTSGRVARAAARARLSEVGMADRERALPSQLSGGQQQRVAIARALVADPVLLLADEPTGNLDADTGRVIVDLLLDLRERRGTTLVLVTHDSAVAARCDRLLRLDSGRLTR